MLRDLAHVILIYRADNGNFNLLGFRDITPVEIQTQPEVEAITYKYVCM